MSVESAAFCADFGNARSGGASKLSSPVAEPAALQGPGQAVLAAGSSACLLRHVFCAVSSAPCLLRRHHQPGRHGKAGLAAERPLGASHAVADRREGAFVRAGRADVFAMPGRVTVEGRHRIAVRDQPGDSLVPYHATGFGEDVESDVCCNQPPGLPDVMQMAVTLTSRDFGIAFSTSVVLGARQPCLRVAAKTLRSAVRTPRVSAPMARSGYCCRPSDRRGGEGAAGQPAPAAHDP